MADKIKVGIFFGGQSREREISFLGGKTAYEHLDRKIFEPVLIFVDSIGNFINVEDDILYYSDIRSFYPSKNQNSGYKVYIESLGPLKETQLYKLIYKIGKQIKAEELRELIDFAFPIMHGPYAEDGSIQGLLEWLNIPYMGPGLLGSAIGIDKPMQNDLLAIATGQTKKYLKISKKEWDTQDRSKLFSDVIKKLGIPLVVKAPHQGSSIGVAIVKKRSMEEFSKAMDQCFFEMHIHKPDWQKLSPRQKKNFVERMSNLDEGIGFPVIYKDQIIYHPAKLLTELDIHLSLDEQAHISAVNAETGVLIEEFITGQEFSMGVIEDNEGKPYGLPPTEIYGEIQTFDFKSKYKSNVGKKRIPVETSDDNLHQIKSHILKAFKATGMRVIARIDGFITPDNQVILHDPNTIPGMSPSSFIFKQMAEIGFSISQSITYFIRQSVKARIDSGKQIFQLDQLLKTIDAKIDIVKKQNRPKLAVLFGENEKEFLIAQKHMAKLYASEEYDVEAVCEAKNGYKYKIPLQLMYKPNIEEFGKAIGKPRHPFIEEIVKETETIRKFYIGSVDFEVSKVNENEFAQKYSFTFNSKTEKLES